MQNAPKSFLPLNPSNIADETPLADVKLSKNAGTPTLK